MKIASYDNNFRNKPNRNEWQNGIAILICTEKVDSDIQSINHILLKFPLKIHFKTGKKRKKIIG